MSLLHRAPLDPLHSGDDSAAGRVTIAADPQNRRLYRLHAELTVAAPREAVFGFFSDARQLDGITPPWLHFELVSPLPIDMRAGTVIDYRLKVRGIPLRWRSLIPVWEPPALFVDEQIRGPYRAWRHEHRFEEHDGGTRIIDEVSYSVPGGALINRLLVQPDLERIFRYRLARLKEIFGESKS